MNLIKHMKRIIINGITFFAGRPGTKIKVTTNSDGMTKIIVNGEVITNLVNAKDVVIKWEGDLASLDCNTAIINGSVQTVDANTVTVHGNVGGNIDCNTITCGDVAGNIDANTVKTIKK